MNYIKINKDGKLNPEYVNSNNEALNYFGRLQNVNLFIGANNSRKSRFLRQLLVQKTFQTYESSPLELVQKLSELTLRLEQYQLDKGASNWGSSFRLVRKGLLKNPKLFLKGIDEKTEDNLKWLESVANEVVNGKGFGSHLFNQKIENILNCFTGENDILKTEYENDLRILITFLNLILVQQEFAYELSHFITGGSDLYDIFEAEEGFISAFIEILEEIFDFDYSHFEPNKIYIPIPRGAVKLNGGESNVHESIYEDTVIDNYALKWDYIKLHTGQDLYTKLEIAKGSHMEVREGVEEFERFIGNYFFQGKKFKLTPRKDPEFRLKKTISIQHDNVEDLIHNLGDGIQSLITLLFPIFTSEKGTWIFIEEPETHLHPGFQNIFLDVVSNSEYLKEKKLKYFFSTHSNHILNRGIKENSSIFSFRDNSDEKNRRSIITQITGRKTSVLDLLGVENSSVFMANCSIWVEGVSDRRYLQSFLMAYQNHKKAKVEFTEGYNYTFFEYAGSNISHYMFQEDTLDRSDKSAKEKIEAHFLSNRIFLLADFDEGKKGSKKKKHDELAKLESLSETKSFQYSHTFAREIENVFPVEIMKTVIKDCFSIKEPKGMDMKYGDYESILLGDYINDKWDSKFPTKTLSTYRKNQMSEYILDKVSKKEITWEELIKSNHIKTITEKLYAFIQKNN